MLILRRLGLALLVWALLTGSATFVCSSGGDLPVRNRAPVAQDDDYQVPAGTVLVGTARASDPDGDPLTFRLIAGPSLGQLQQFDGGTGAFHYLSQVAGGDSFSFRADDGVLESNTGRVRITVTTGSAVLESPASAAGTVAFDDGRPGLLVAAFDPWDPSRVLVVLAAPGGVRIGQDRLDGFGPLWLSEIPAQATGAALQFSLSDPGKTWLALHQGGCSTVLTSDDGGHHWRPVAELPGIVTAIAGLNDGRRGVIVLRQRPEPAALILAADGREDF